jgi:hypothetical protein
MGGSSLSSSVTIDWRAIRERERQACLALRAELARLQAREKQLRLRAGVVSAAHGRLPVEIYRVGHAHSSADSAELGRLVSAAQAGLARGAEALEKAISSASSGSGGQATRAATWTTRSTSAMAPAPRTAPEIDLDRLTRESRPSARDDDDRSASAAFAAEADAVIEECRLRCPETDLAELTALRAELGHSPLGDPSVIQNIRIRAARTIKRVQRENELEEQRQRLFVLAEDAPVAERAALRRRVADARPEDVPPLDREVTAAVERASAERARAEAVAALEQALRELDYDVQDGFSTLLSASATLSPGQEAADTPTAPAAPRFLVAVSPHSADHGLRVRVGEDQVYLSVVRRAGTAGPDVLGADTRVQEQTCRDLLTAVESAGTGVQMLIGNVQAPGRHAPELGAEHWPAMTPAQADASADEQAEERRRAWARQEQQAAARAQSRPRQPGQ